MLGPNLDIVGKVNHTYEMMMNEDLTKKQTIETGHKNFLLTAVYFLFIANRQKEAAYWYDYLGKLYPQAVVDRKTGKKVPLDEFAVAQAMGEVSETDKNKTTSLIMGFLKRSYDALAQGENDLSANYELLAQKAWNRYQKEIEGSQGRVGLDPMPTLKSVVLDEMLAPDSGFPEVLKDRLRTELGISAPKNAPATNAPPDQAIKINPQ